MVSSYSTDQGDMKSTFDERVAFLEKKAREVRFHIVDMIFQAQSGHPGGSLSCADICTALYFDILNINPKDPHWPNRDRFILSKGHACPVWYACLALRGFFSMDHLKRLRKFESLLQGHPDMKKTIGVDMTTGSLGQGLSLGVGMALEGALSNKGYYVYVVLGDGELNEGQIWEAAASAAKFRLNRLIAVIDRNRLQLDGDTEEVMPMDSIATKFEAFNWKVLSMNGHDMKDILKTFESVEKGFVQPVAIIADTVKGKGVSFMEGRREWHGRAPNREEYMQAVEEILGERHA